MIRSIWKGQINFGMVSIPAKLYGATDDKKVGLHQYHRDCGSRLSMLKYCPACDRKLESHEIERGYELSKEQHIILTEGDLASLPLASLKTIEIVEFVDPTEIDIRSYASSYFLGCEDVGAKAYRLFLNAMEKVGVVGVAKLAYRDREHLSVVMPYGGIMLLQTLHYSDELRAYDELKPRQAALADNEMEMAEKLVSAMVAEFDPSKYSDHYREALENLIERKLAGEVITTSTPEQQPISDVADALIKSLELAGVKA